MPKKLSFEPLNTQFSIEHAYGLALCSQLAYEVNQGKVLDALKPHGFRAEFLERRDTQCFVAYSKDAIVVSFRGTTNINDWLTNSDTILVSPKPGLPKVHSGFLRALCIVWDNLLAILEKVQKTQTLWLTGHSLGGALATVAAARFALELDKPLAGVYTFGQPRVGDREFARDLNAILKSRFFRFVNNSDLVTRVPSRVRGYSHVGSLRFFDDDGELHEDIGYWNRFLEGVKGGFSDDVDGVPSNVANHSSALYIENINKNR